MANVINTNQIETIISDFLNEIDADDITKEWFNTTFRKYVINKWPDRKIVEFNDNLPEWAIKSLNSGIEVEEVNLNKNHLYNIYNKYKYNRSRRISVEDLLLKDDNNIIIYIDKKIKWVRPSSKNNFSRYGFQLRSCLKNYFNQVEKGLIDIHILLDDDIAVAVIGIIDNKITQIKGYKNRIVDKKYWSIMRDYIKNWDDIKKSELPNIGMIDKNQFIEDNSNIIFDHDLNLSEYDKINTPMIFTKGSLNINDSSFVSIDRGVINDNLYCRNCELNTKNITVYGNIFANGLKNKIFSEENILCFGSMFLQNSSVEVFNYFEVDGDLCIDNTKIKDVSKTHVKGNFYARNSSIKNLPYEVDRSIIIPNTSIDNLNIKIVYGDLNISGTNIKELKDITIMGNLYIIDSKIKEIDETVEVEGVIFSNQDIKYKNSQDRLIFEASDYVY